MKHVCTFILAAAALTLCACSDNESLPDITGSLVKEYLIPERMEATLEITHGGTAYFRCGFSGKTVDKNTAGFNSLAIGFGDISYPEKAGAYSASALGSKITAIHVTADAPYDAQHPAGAPLDDLFRIYGVTFYDYIKNDYRRDTTSDRVEGLRLIRWSRTEGRTICRHLDQATAEDLYLLSSDGFYLIPDYLPATALQVTVTMERVGEPPLVSTFTIDPASKKYLSYYKQYLVPDTMILSFSSQSNSILTLRGSFEGTVIDQNAPQFNALAQAFTDTCYMVRTETVQTRIPLGALFTDMEITADVDYGNQYPAGSSLADLAVYTGQTAYPYVKQQYPSTFVQKKLMEMQASGYEMPAAFASVYNKPVAELTVNDIYMIGDNTSSINGVYSYGAYSLTIGSDEFPPEAHTLTVRFKQKNGPDLIGVYAVDR